MRRLYATMNPVALLLATGPGAAPEPEKAPRYTVPVGDALDEILDRLRAAGHTEEQIEAVILQLQDVEAGQKEYDRLFEAFGRASLADIGPGAPPLPYVVRRPPPAPPPEALRPHGNRRQRRAAQASGRAGR